MDSVGNVQDAVGPLVQLWQADGCKIQSVREKGRIGKTEFVWKYKQTNQITALPATELKMTRI